jgi:hypothetical protein
MAWPALRHAPPYSIQYSGTAQLAVYHSSDGKNALELVLVAKHATVVRCISELCLELQQVCKALWKGAVY